MAQIRGKADGIMTLINLSLNLRLRTLATLRWSLSIEETPNAVLTRVGHNEHKATVIAEAKNAGFTSNELNIGSLLIIERSALFSGSGIKPPTTIRPIGSHTIGETGLKIAMNGVNAHINVLFKPHKIPNGIATIVAIMKPVNTHSRERSVWYGNVLAAEY